MLLCVVVSPFFSVGLQLRRVGDALIRWTLAGLEAKQQSKRCQGFRYDVLVGVGRWC